MTANRVRLVVSTMSTRHNLGAYEEAGLAWHHVPVPVTAAGTDALDEILGLLRTELRRPGAVAIHGNRHTDFVAAVAAAHLHDVRRVPLEAGLAQAAGAGLMVSPDSCALLGIGYEAVVAPA